VIVKFSIGRFKFIFSFATTAKVVGVNSKLRDGRHFLMWDFDSCDLNTVIGALDYVQEKYSLPDIYVFETKKDENYIAMCPKKLPFIRVIHILSDTPMLDFQFFKYGIMRGHFTLRISMKEGRPIRLVRILRSDRKHEITIKDVQSFTAYETLTDEMKYRFIRIGR